MAGDAPVPVDLSLFKYTLKELINPAKTHVLDYLRSETAYTKHFLSTVLTAGMEEAAPPNEQTIVVGLVEQPSYPHHIPGADYEYFLTANDADFNTIFRMKRSTIHKLKSVIETRLTGSSEAHVKKKVLLTVWLLGNRETFGTAAAMFGLTEHSVYRIFHDMCYELTILAGKYVKWPSPDECTQTASTFNTVYGFPGVIGVIGYSYMEIRIPDKTVDKDKYFNEELNHHAILVQIVVDGNMLIRDACAGFSGSTSPLQAFVHSPIYPRMTNVNNPLIRDEEHLLGSAAYPQLASLLTPYSYETNHRPITSEEEEFNGLHETASLVLDETFKQLRERFQRVNCIDVYQPELASKVVIAACVLHNFAILLGDKFND